MSIFTGILFIVCVLYASYRIIIKTKNYVNRNVPSNNNIVINNVSIDMRFHSAPNFDFPNVQSESDLRIANTGPDLSAEPSELKVKQYCNF